MSENFHVLMVKFSVYLNRHVFVMRRTRGKNHLTIRKQNLAFPQFPICDLRVAQTTAVRMSTYNVCFHREIKKMVLFHGKKFLI